MLVVSLDWISEILLLKQKLLLFTWYVNIFSGLFCLFCLFGIFHYDDLILLTNFIHSIHCWPFFSCFLLLFLNELSAQFEIQIGQQPPKQQTFFRIFKKLDFIFPFLFCFIEFFFCFCFVYIIGVSH